MQGAQQSHQEMKDINETMTEFAKQMSLLATVELKHAPPELLPKPTQFSMDDLDLLIRMNDQEAKNLMDQVLEVVYTSCVENVPTNDLIFP